MLQRQRACDMFVSSPPLIWQGLAVLSLLCACCDRGEAKAYKKVSDIGNAMNSEMKFSRACYKLLNATGAIGCEAPDERSVNGILAYYSDIINGLTEDRVVVVASADFDALMQRTLDDVQFGHHVKGVLVDARDPPAQLSSAAKFPGAAYAPYAGAGAVAASYVWNPPGSGLARQYFPMPVFIMTPKLAADTVWRARYNKAQNWFKGALHVADMELDMQGEKNSLSCMNKGTCQPVGGYSTWTSLPPLNGSGVSPAAQPITLVTAQVDSDGFFHDVVQGSNSPLSGLISMLAALQILAENDMSATYTRHLAFAAVAGEPWDYMGSRRLLWEMQQGTAVTAGLNLTLIDQVIELGQVGQAFNPAGGTSSLYLHSQKGAAYGDTTPLANALEQGTKQTIESTVTLTAASASNPGIPPSTLMSFLRVKPGIAGVVLTDFDTQYTNKYYQSEFDLPNNTAANAMVTTAIVLARALHTLASEGYVDVKPLKVSLATTTNFVASLSQCLQDDSVGLQCPLALALIAPGYIAQDGVTSFAVRHYIGVLPQIPSSPQDPYLRADVSRFLYNLMGTLTAVGSAGTACAPREALCTNANQVCIGWKSGTTDPNTLGRCLNTTVFYVPSVSTKFWFGSAQGYYGWHITNDSWAWEQAMGWPQDPMWTESNWPESTPRVRIYQREAYSVEVAVLVSGLLLMLATGVVSYIMRSAYERQLKRQ